jgi:hypothetical protein
MKNHCGFLLSILDFYTRLNSVLIGQEIRLLTTKRASRRTLLLKKFIPIDRAGARVLDLYNWGSQRNSDGQEPQPKGMRLEGEI